MNTYKIINDIYKKNKSCYIIYGKEYFLIQKYKEIILKKLKKNNIKNFINIEINVDKNWEEFFYKCKKRNFFYKKKIIILKININNINNNILKKIHKNKFIINFNIIIIILKESNYKKIINYNLKKKIFKNQLLIPCFNFKKYEFFQWITTYLKNNTIDEKSKNFLYKRYKNDILLLNQNLDFLSLSLLNKKITIKKIKKILIHDKVYTIFEWMNYLLLGKNKKSLLILHILYKIKTAPLIIVRFLENKIVNLILLKKKKKNKIEKFFKEKKIWQSHKKLYLRSIKKNKYSNFLKIIKSLNWIKLSIKSIEEESIWIILKEISIMFK
ncbi:DNA polymerase III subunit delta [Buchnera aphidicola (Periphyllus testudinaceus)]|uniref:DNA polymerase III subunit delta n=1 Tax=Buchnera aphidicola TaxID=9 RepID=UPI003463BC0F